LVHVLVGKPVATSPEHASRHHPKDGGLLRFRGLPADGRRRILSAYPADQHEGGISHFRPVKLKK
jgi:hypothetical protein